MEGILVVITQTVMAFGIYFSGALLSLTFRNVIGSPFLGFRPLKFEDVLLDGMLIKRDTDWMMLFCWPVAIVLWDVTRLLLSLPKRLTLRVVLLTNKVGNRIIETKNRYITGGRND